MLGQRVIKINRYVKEHGIHLKYLTDFENYRAVVEAHNEVSAVTAVLDTRVSDIGPENGFWILATDEMGEVIHVQAVRSDDLTGSTLSRHWLSDPMVYAPAWLDIDINRCDFDTAPITHEITGTVCYHADFWLHKKHRNMELASLFSNYAMVLALTKFRPDYFYGLMSPKLVKLGWVARAGYLHMHPRAPRWYILKDGTYYDEYLVWVTGPELADLWASGKRDTKVLGQVAKNTNPLSTVQ